MAANGTMAAGGAVAATSTASVDWTQPLLWGAAAFIVALPTAWNIVARNEYRNHTITKAVGSAKTGCYMLAVAIFTLGLVRDYLFHQALLAQPPWELLQDPMVQHLANALFVVANILVLSSMFVLGVTGTYLGDYFGILMKARVTGFPFNIMENPMYNGATLNFLALALWHASPAGLVLTAVVFATYQVALQFEGPFTAQIYADRANAAAKLIRRKVHKE